MIRISSIFLLIFLCGMLPDVSCQCEEDAVYVAQGQITSLDWVKGVIVVKLLQSSPDIGYDEITIQVPRDINITKGSDTVGFVDVNQFDRVTVQCRRQKIGLPKAISITIDNPV